MARNPKRAAAPKAAAKASPPPAAPPAGPAQGATEATASSMVASGTAATGAGVIAPTGGGQASQGVALAVAGLEAIADRLDPRNMTPLLGSSVQPEVIDLGHGVTIALVDLISTAAPLVTSSAAEWNGQPEATREQMIALAIETARDQVAQAHAPIEPPIGDLVVEPEPVPAGLVRVEGKSRDDQPFRRGGIAWNANFATHLVDEATAFVLANDPHLIVRFE